MPPISRNAVITTARSFSPRVVWMSSMSTWVGTFRPLCPRSRTQRHVELAVQRVGDPQQRVDLRRPSAGLQPCDRRLRRVAQLRELLLREVARETLFAHLPGDPGEEPVVPFAYSDHAIQHIARRLFLETSDRLELLKRLPARVAVAHAAAWGRAEELPQKSPRSRRQRALLRRPTARMMPSSRRSWRTFRMSASPATGAALRMSAIVNSSLIEARMNCLIASVLVPRRPTALVFASNRSYAATRIPTMERSQCKMSCCSSCQPTVEAESAS